MPGGSSGIDLPDVVELTAKTLIVRAVFVEPQSGQGTFASAPLIDLMNFSKRDSQDWQVYS